MRSISHKCGNFCSSSQDVLSLLWPEMIFLEKLKRWLPTANLVATSPSDVAIASTTTVQPKKSAQFSGKSEQIMTQLESLNVNIKFFSKIFGLHFHGLAMFTCFNNSFSRILYDNFSISTRNIFKFYSIFFLRQVLEKVYKNWRLSFSLVKSIWNSYADFGWVNIQ